MTIKRIWKEDGQEETITLTEAKKIIKKEYQDSGEVVKKLKKGYGVDTTFSYLEKK